jgi:hypothetical protein
MKEAREFRAIFVRDRLDDRPPEKLVRALVELGNRVDGCERPFVGTLEAIEARGYLFQAQFFERHVVRRALPCLFS